MIRPPGKSEQGNVVDVEQKMTRPRVMGGPRIDGVPLGMSEARARRSLRGEDANQEEFLMQRLTGFGRGTKRGSWTPWERT